MERKPMLSKGEGVLIDPLHRVLVPIEGKTSLGVWTFKTVDGDAYYRESSGAIRRKNPKVNGKQARRARAAVRRET